jgi:hypothetical protein
VTWKTILVRALVAVAVFAGCASTSGGGSQTNWDTCKTNNDCAMGKCVQGVCRNSGGPNDSGASDGKATGSGSSSNDATATGLRATGELGPWVSTPDYPLAANSCAGTAPNLYCAEQTCVADSAYVYCLGGASTSTYSNSPSSTGLRPWRSGADYPVPIQQTSCVVGAVGAPEYLYCVGGRVRGADGGAGHATADVYYAILSETGAIGPWTAANPFPHATLDPQCMFAANNNIYCISRNPDDVTRTDAYFASLSTGRLGAWAPTAGPPTGTAACAAVGGFVYCFGGGNCAPSGPRSDCNSPSYFAPLTETGIGAWKATTELPTAVSATYAAAGSYIYYLSTPVFFASVSAEGIGPWQTTTNYPDPAYPSNCFSHDDRLYCASPTANGSYSAQIGASNPRALHLENPPPFPRSEYLAPAWNNGSGCSVSENGVFAGAPCFTRNIDDAFVFDCASQAATAAGCKTTVVSSDPAYNFDVTVWYPCKDPTGTDANCCFLPSVGYDTPFNDWCISVGSNSFIIASRIKL